MRERLRVLVPLTLHGPEAEAVFRAAPEVELEFALPAEERVYGGGALGPAEQRRRAIETVRRRLPEIDALCSLPGPRFVTAELLDAAPRLRVVFIGGAGTDPIDIDAATARGVAVVNAPGANYVSVGEHCVGLILTMVRKIAWADRTARARGRALHLAELGGFPGTLRGKTVGLVGFGAIGREVGRICSVAFGAEILVFDPQLPPAAITDAGFVSAPSLAELLQRADVVSLHVPLVAETRGLIGASELALMKPSSFLVNTARGAVVDTEALSGVLARGAIAGAGLDVTDPEPLPPGHPLLSEERLVLTPHAAGASPELVVSLNVTAAENALAALRMQRPATLVNPDVWPEFERRWARRNDA